MVSDSNSASPSEEREAYSYAHDGSDEAQSSYRSVNNNEVSSCESSSSSGEGSPGGSTGSDGIGTPRGQADGAKVEVIEAYEEVRAKIEQSEGGSSVADPDYLIVRSFDDETAH